MVVSTANSLQVFPAGMAFLNSSQIAFTSSEDPVKPRCNGTASTGLGGREAGKGEVDSEGLFSQQGCHS